MSDSDQRAVGIQGSSTDTSGWATVPGTAYSMAGYATGVPAARAHPSSSIQAMYPRPPNEAVSKSEVQTKSQKAKSAPQPPPPNQESYSACLAAQVLGAYPAFSAFLGQSQNQGAYSGYPGAQVQPQNTTYQDPNYRSYYAPTDQDPNYVSYPINPYLQQEGAAANQGNNSYGYSHCGTDYADGSYQQWQGYYDQSSVMQNGSNGSAYMYNGDDGIAYGAYYGPPAKTARVEETPAMALMRMRPEIHFQDESVEPGSFVCVVYVDGDRYKGMGPDAESAKEASAECALRLAPFALARETELTHIKWMFPPPMPHQYQRCADYYLEESRKTLVVPSYAHGGGRPLSGPPGYPNLALGTSPKEEAVDDDAPAKEDGTVPWDFGSGEAPLLRNPVNLLRELEPDVSYVITKRRLPSKEWEFVCRIRGPFKKQKAPFGEDFLGLGETIKLARMKSAWKCLGALHSIRLPHPEKIVSIWKRGEIVGEPEDAGIEFFNLSSPPATDATDVAASCKLILVPKPGRLVEEVVKELHPAVEVRLNRSYNVQLEKFVFKAKIMIGDTLYAGEADTAEDAKDAAMKDALETLYHANCARSVEEMATLLVKRTAGHNFTNMAHRFDNLVGSTCARLNQARGGRFALVAITKEAKPIPVGFEALVLASSSGTPLEDVFSAGGNGVKDLRSVCVARRALVNYLMDQISDANDGKVSIFVKKTTPGKKVYFELRPDVKFYLFASADALLEDKHDLDVSLGQDGRNEVAADSKIGLNGVEKRFGDGEDQRPAGRPSKSTVLKIQQKLASWNVIGIQGGILTSLIQRPIRFNCIAYDRDLPEKDVVRNVLLSVPKMMPDRRAREETKVFQVARLVPLRSAKKDEAAISFYWTSGMKSAVAFHGKDSYAALSDESLLKKWVSLVEKLDVAGTADLGTLQGCVERFVSPTYKELKEEIMKKFRD